jgi:hypothetical protein
MNGRYDIYIKIDFFKDREQDEQQFLREVEDNFKSGLENIMNRMENGNGKMSEFRITKMENQ